MLFFQSINFHNFHFQSENFHMKIPFGFVMFKIYSFLIEILNWFNNPLLFFSYFLVSSFSFDRRNHHLHSMWVNKFIFFLFSLFFNLTLNTFIYMQYQSLSRHWYSFWSLLTPISAINRLVTESQFQWNKSVWPPIIFDSHDCAYFFQMCAFTVWYLITFWKCI